MKRLLVFVFAVTLFGGCEPELSKGKESIKFDYPESALNDKNFQSLNQLGKLVGTWKVQSKQVENLSWLLEIYKVKNVFAIVEIHSSECIFHDAEKEEDERKGFLKFIPDYDVNETGEYYSLKEKTGAISLCDRNGDMSDLYSIVKFNYNAGLI